MSGCKGCGTTPLLFNKFIAAVGNQSVNVTKPGPFDGVVGERRNFNKTILPEKNTNLIEKQPVQMNGNGMFVKFTRTLK
jgi:hypothetical protein